MDWYSSIIIQNLRGKGKVGLMKFIIFIEDVQYDPVCNCEHRKVIIRIKHLFDAS